MPTYYQRSWTPTTRFQSAPHFATYAAPYATPPLYLEQAPAPSALGSSLATGAVIGLAAGIVLLLLTSGTKRRRAEF